MPIGPKISTHIKIKIADTYVQMRKQDSKVTAKEVKKAVQEELSKGNPNLPNDWPGLSAVQKVITEIRKGEGERSPEQRELDKPWSVLDIAKHPIPPEILPMVLKAWAREVLKDDPLTIREVLWMARIYYIFRETKTKKKERHLFYGGLAMYRGDEMAALIDCAKELALHDILINILGEHPDKAKNMWAVWDDDVWLYTFLSGGDDLSLKITDKYLDVIGPESPPPLYDVERLRKAEIYRESIKEAQHERSHNKEVQE